MNLKKKKSNFKTKNQNSKTDIKLKFRSKIERVLNLFQIFLFWF